MLLNMILVALCGILGGIIIGFLMCRPVIRQRMYEVETYWKQKLAMINADWTNFHKTEVNKWINKTYYETVQERDKAWEQKLSGTKPKPKAPSN